MTDKSLLKITLPNNLRMTCKRNPANPTVSFALRIATGSEDEPVEKFGLAGLAGALITKGTSKKSPGEIAQAIDEIGMEMAFQAGKHTGLLTARVMSENLEKALMLTAEVLANPAPPDDEVDRMRQRMITGIKMKLDDPAAVVTDRLMQMIYGPEHLYGRGMALMLKTLSGISRDDLSDYYSSRLLPGATMGVIVGDINTSNLDDIFKRTLGSWQGGGEFKVEPPAPVSLPDEPLSTDIPMPGKTQSDIALGFQGIRRVHPDYYALLTGNTVLGRLSLGGRIGRRVRDTEGMAYYAFTTFDAGIGAGPFMFRAGVNPANVGRSVELAIDEMSKAKKEGITQEELNDAVLFLQGSMTRQIETNGGMAATLLAQELYDLGDDYYLRFADIIGALSLDKVNKALKTHLHPEQYCLAVAGPKE
jgi:zinc protease